MQGGQGELPEDHSVSWVHTAGSTLLGPAGRVGVGHVEWGGRCWQREQRLTAWPRVASVGREVTGPGLRRRGREGP